MTQTHEHATQRSTVQTPQVRRISTDDLWEALYRGFQDFLAKPSHLFVLGAIYPIAGILLMWLFAGYQIVPLLFPLIAGFAIIGPFAAIGLYELSRRREAGLEAEWRHAAGVMTSPSIGAILALAALLTALFFGWLLAALIIYGITMPGPPPETIAGFATQILTSPGAVGLIVIGNLVGFVFAAVTLVISVVSFPFLVDRKAGAAEAIALSLRASAANPKEIALWGLIVAVLLVLGALPLLVGLAIVVPVLGHATWHLYRKLVSH